MRLYSKEQLHLGLSARRTGGGQRDQGSPVGESPSLEDGPGAGLSYVVKGLGDPRRVRARPRVVDRTCRPPCLRTAARADSFDMRMSSVIEQMIA